MDEELSADLENIVKMLSDLPPLLFKMCGFHSNLTKIPKCGEFVSLGTLFDLLFAYRFIFGETGDVKKLSAQVRSCFRTQKVGRQKACKTCSKRCRFLTGLLGLLYKI